MFPKLWVIFGFKIHEDFIAEELCVNDDYLTKVCKGKCYLIGELEIAEEEQSPKRIIFKEISNINLYIVTPLYLNIKELEIIKTFPNNGVKHISSFLYVKDLLRPPISI